MAGNKPDRPAGCYDKWHGQTTATEHCATRASRGALGRGGRRPSTDISQDYPWGPAYGTARMKTTATQVTLAAILFASLGAFAVAHAMLSGGYDPIKDDRMTVAQAEAQSVRLHGIRGASMLVAIGAATGLLYVWRSKRGKVGAPNHEPPVHV